MQDPFRPSAIAVCVPVRNEAALLPGLLHALARQEVVPGTTVTLCFLLDACRDASGALLAAFAQEADVPVRIAASRDGSVIASAGRARRRAMAIGEALGADTLLTTDADSVPAPDWIAACCRGLAASDVVAGRIVRGGDAVLPIQDRLEAYLDRLHRLRRHCDPVPWECPRGHHMTGGANLAFRADAYRVLGGFAEVIAGEDGAIVDAAHRLGLRVRRDSTALVTTSSRRHGRAVSGLADHLRRLESATALPMVAHPDDAAWQYRGHAAARAGHGLLQSTDAVTQLALLLEVDTGHVARIAAETVNAEAFATRVVPTAPGGGRLVPLDIAEDALDWLEHAAFERAA